jgi:hypothetical protein
MGVRYYRFLNKHLQVPVFPRSVMRVLTVMISAGTMWFALLVLFGLVPLKGIED